MTLALPMAMVPNGCHVHGSTVGTLPAPQRMKTPFGMCRLMEVPFVAV